MKNSNEMNHAVYDNYGGHIDRDCNAVTVEINQVSFKFCSGCIAFNSLEKKVLTHSSWR